MKLRQDMQYELIRLVASLAEAWIEIWNVSCALRDRSGVASLAEAWIEITGPIDAETMQTAVASLAEAWIEMRISLQDARRSVVAFLAEAWIEILVKSRQTIAYMSPP